MTHPARWKKNTSAAVDMTGYKRDGWEVLEKVGAVAGSTTWRAKHSCGAVHIVLGTRLRKGLKFCPTCRPTGKAAA